MQDSYVCTSAMMTCSFGMGTSTLTVNPSRTVMLQGKQRANIGDYIPSINIGPFGMCSAPSNPSVISATAAAMGVPTPMPCFPVITTPWFPGKPDVLIQGMPALTRSSKNMCVWLGQITFVTDGQTPTPPPMNMTPRGKLDCEPKGNSAALTTDELKNLSEEDKEHYKNDLEKAEQAGAKEQLLAGAWAKTAEDYERKGEAGKAEMARQMEEKNRNIATDKKNQAISDVNRQYRETLPPSKEDLDKLSNSQRQEYEQKRTAINAEKQKAYREAEIDRQLSDNVAKDMMAPDNYGDPREMQANKSTALLISVTGAAREQSAKKKADENAYNKMKLLNQETRLQIQQDGC
ncbi:MAG: DUF4280 domain-containing protein [Prevotella sp.]|nr:DUF4280 domain-containing protein [Prevotella sp.]